MDSKLFGGLDIRNDVHRNGFDLSSSLKFTAKCGELLPVYHKTLMPGDNFKMRVSHFTRTSPVQTCAFTQIREFFDWFFVPYRQLWKNAPQVLSQNRDNPNVARSFSSNNVIGTNLPKTHLSNLLLDSSKASHPISSVLNKLGQNNGKDYVNAFGFNRAYGFVKLLNHLGYCYTSNDFVSKSQSGGAVPNKPYEYDLSVCLFPLLAYQKIYYDFFRNSLWENNQPYNYNVDYLDDSAYLTINYDNVDYWKNPTMFDLRYSNYPKDLFFGILPDTQDGDTAVADIDFGDKNLFLRTSYHQGDTENKVTVGPNVATGGHSITSYQLSQDDPLLVRNSDIEASLDMLNLRKANFLQKYREIMGSGKKDYKNIVQKIFGTEVSDLLSDSCVYLGGDSSTISISEVVNQNLADGNSADIKGKGVGNGDGNNLEFNCQDFGVIMCIYHAQPIVDYSLNALNFDVAKTNVDDYANPVFDKLGFQELPCYFFSNDYGVYHAHTNPIPQALGYTTRYFDYKTHMDNVLGDFRESLQTSTWVSPVNTDYIKNYMFANSKDIYSLHINYNFFKVNPTILDSIFVVNADEKVNTDQLLINANFIVNAVRNLDYNGVPY